jgi:4-hydroxy-tetrahydrodipicolinate reductase
MGEIPMSTKVSIAGVTGWTGSAVAKAVLQSTEFDLVGALARDAAGEDAGLALGLPENGVTISRGIDGALPEGTEVLIDYTHPGVVKHHVLTALKKGVSVVIGTSGLSAEDYAEVEVVALETSTGAIAAGNFSLTAALVKHFAGIAAKHIPQWEIIDYSSASKPDAPSGTARELADFLGEVAENRFEVDPADTLGEPQARGVTLGGAQVHSLRLPSYVLSFEALFGLPNERLSLRHDAGSGAEPYVNGTLLAAKEAVSLRGLVRGLDRLLFPEPG